MGYRKARIPIRVIDGIDYRKGYIFESRFSNGELFTMGVYKNSKEEWIVSDLNTGLFVNCGVTRVDAVKKFQKNYLSKLERIIYSNNNHYERATIEFLAMVLVEGAK